MRSFQQYGLNAAILAIHESFDPPRRVGPTTTLDQLAAALENPLPPKPAGPPAKDYFEALASYKPLTLEFVRELVAEKEEARARILADYIKHTGQQVEFCDSCGGTGKDEEEEEYGWQTFVHEVPCRDCDGRGVVLAAAQKDWSENS